MAYRNESKGARAIHLTNGGYVLVEPGAVSTVDPRSIRRLAPDLVECEDPEVPPVPEELAAAVKSGESKLTDLKKADLVKLAGVSAAEAKKLTRAQLIDKIEAK